MTDLIRTTRNWSLYTVTGRSGKPRHIVQCPFDLPELTWENDFGRGMRCYCRTFPTRGKAERYINKHKELEQQRGQCTDNTDPAYAGE